ncbi:SNARE-interacting protein KEULE [Camellia lanceoleosa]|uniref:SNARE-interacting protein KEULE n=1 Tax=Camellia lanceoleosa TaxID=1840588 RepID=A0ACC0F516_9ERIC|nr:SNARE-interacting protein KEULE [Camellia lanceoleosa]
MTTFRDLMPTKLAAGVWNCLMKYKVDLPNFPQTETCELLVVDRSVDQIAPVIHEWTYDAMCHDLLNMDGNKYVHEIYNEQIGELIDPTQRNLEIRDDTKHGFYVENLTEPGARSWVNSASNSCRRYWLKGMTTGDLKRRDDKIRHDESSTPTMEINTGENGGRMKPSPTMEIKTDEGGLYFEDCGFLLYVVVKMSFWCM